MKPFIIAHPQAAMGCFLHQRSTEGDAIGYFYGTLVFQFMVDARNARSVLEEGVTAPTREQLPILEIKLGKEVFSWISFLHTVWFVPATFLCLHFINDHRTLPGEIVPAGRRPKRARSQNVKLVDTRTAIPNITKLDAVSERARHNIGQGEEPLVDYEDKYEFKQICNRSRLGRHR